MTFHPAPEPTFESVKEVRVFFEDGSCAVASRFNRTAEHTIENLQYQNSELESIIKRLNGEVSNLKEEKRILEVEKAVLFSLLKQSNSP